MAGPRENLAVDGENYDIEVEDARSFRPWWVSRGSREGLALWNGLRTSEQTDWTNGRGAIRALDLDQGVGCQPSNSHGGIGRWVRLLTCMDEGHRKLGLWQSCWSSSGEWWRRGSLLLAVMLEVPGLGFLIWRPALEGRKRKSEEELRNGGTKKLGRQVWSSSWRNASQIAWR